MTSLHELIIYVILILPISTLFVSQSISNKVLFFLSMLALAWILIKRLTRKSLLMLSILVFEFFISLEIGGTLKFYNLNDIFYLPQWVMLCMYYSEYLNSFNDKIQKHSKLMKYCIYLWEILFVVLRITMPSMNQEFAHRTASSAFLVVVMVWYYSKRTGNKPFNLHMIIPLAAIFLLQVRTYLVIALVVACMAYYSAFRRKRYFFATIIPMGCLVIYCVLQTSIGARFTNVQESYYGGVLATITSSRSVFWAEDIRAFVTSSWTRKLFGNGYNLIYDVNNRIVHTLIWGHNDIIHILVTNGILGLYIYLHAFFSFVRKYVSRVKIDRRLLYMALGALVFCALFDGLYHYTCALYAVPFMFDGLREQSGGHNNGF